MFILSDTSLKKYNVIYIKATINIQITKSTTRNLDNDNIEEKNMTLKLSKKNEYNYKDKEIIWFTTEDAEFTELISQYEQNQIKIVVTNIEYDNDNSDNKDKELYIFDVYLGENADNQLEQEVDFSSIITNEVSNYSISIYKVQDMSSCSDEYKFNLTTNIEVEGNDEVTLVFKGNHRNKDIQNKALCKLSSKNKKIISCQFEREIPNLNLTLNDYLSFDSNKLISISLENKDIFFSFNCEVEPPIAAIIFIATIFLFVVIIVIIIIIVINKKGRGERGYEMPNNSNVNNVLGLSSGNASK